MTRSAFVGLLLLAACSKDSAAPKLVPQLSIVEGNAQRDTVGRTLPVQLGAKLIDSATGQPLAGRVLNWIVVDGGGSVFATITQTGSQGLARNAFTLGHGAGAQKVVARYIDPETGDPVTLDTARAMATPDVAVQFLAGFGPNPNPAGSNVLAVGDTGLVVFSYRDAWTNAGAPCVDGRDGDRAIWSSSDSSAIMPLGTIVVLSDGRHAAQVLAKQVVTPGVTIMGDPSGCAPTAAGAGVAFLVR